MEEVKEEVGRQQHTESGLSCYVGFWSFKEASSS